LLGRIWREPYEKRATSVKSIENIGHSNKKIHQS